MNPARFYGSAKHVNPIPGNGLLSEDEFVSDSDFEAEATPSRSPNKKHVIILDSTSDSNSSDDDTSLHVLQAVKPKGKKGKKERAVGKNEKVEHYDKNKYKFEGKTDLPEEILKLDSPADFFKFFFTENIIAFIVEQSNLKSVQDNINKPAGITYEEMEKFIGILLFMSCVKLPGTRMYWSKSVGQAQVYDIMTCNRFECIKRFLHFNNNDNYTPFGTQGHDKLFKIRPLLDKIRQQLLLVPKEEFLAIDEQVIPTKCCYDIKQNDPAKPHKWGYKNLVLSGVSGFSYDFDIFAGEQSNTYPPDAPDLGVNSNVVTRLTATVPRHMNYKICFGNWFNSPNLQEYLCKNGMLPQSTVRLNRVPNSMMPSEKEFKKRVRGSFEEEMAVIDEVKYMEVTSPQAIDVYKQHMGRVDLLHSILGYYRIHLRTRKWYKRIFFHMIDLCTVNAWLLWRRANEAIYMPLFDFKLGVAEYLTKVGKPLLSTKKRGHPGSLMNTPTSSRASTPLNRAGTPSSMPDSTISSKKPRKAPTRHQELPLSSIRTDNIDHFPIWVKNQRQICQNCLKLRSYTKCEKCEVFLCYNDKRNCFKDFHKHCNAYEAIYD